MKKLKKISNYLLMIGGILTALSGIVNTTMDIVGNFKKEDKKEEVMPVPVATIEQKIQGAPGVRISKTVEIPSAEDIPEKPMDVAASAPAPTEPEQPTMESPLKETKNTLWWVLATIIGSFVASVCWYIHVRLHVSLDVKKKDE